MQNYRNFQPHHNANFVIKTFTSNKNLKQNVA